jgi:murein DD-endopeptidase MepM/ murein hydrolase activator NlpD
MRFRLVAMALLLAAATAGPTAANPKTSQLTAIVVSAIGGPVGVPGSDGLEHIEYDLLVTNVFTAPVTLTAIEVLTLDGERLLLLEGDALVMATQPLLGLTPLAEILPSAVAAVMIDVAVPRSQIPESLTHRIAYTLPEDAPGAGQIESFTIDGPELGVDARAPVVIAPPVHGPGWLNAFSCCDATSIHRGVRAAVDGARIVKSETFAIDWVLLQDGRPFAGDGARNEEWFGYGAEVTSAAPGTVIFTRDGQPDGTPMSLPSVLNGPGAAGGNQVIVQIAPGVWAFYAHLQPGSVAVEVGDQVVTGQLIGTLGNSGNSIGPHLHFGLIDGPDPMTASSVPMVLDRYDLTGAVDPTSLFAVLSDPAALELRVDAVSQPQRGTLPLNMTVTDFR